MRSYHDFARLFATADNKAPCREIISLSRLYHMEDSDGAYTGTVEIGLGKSGLFGH